MDKIHFALVTVGLTLLSGCLGSASTDRSMVESRFSSVQQKLAKISAPMVNSMRQITSQRPSSNIPNNWDWATAIPKQTPRSEAMRPTIGGDSLAAIVPSFEQSRQVRLVSTAVPKSSFEVTRVGKAKIKNLLQMHSAVQQHLESGDKVAHLEAIPSGASREQPGIALEVNPNQLLALSQYVAADKSVARVYEDGNPWILIREGSVRAKMMARVERQRGLVHLLLSMANCWGADRTLPTELRVQADGQPLRCLTVGETLEMLYGSSRNIASDPEGSSLSFANVSEQNDYLIPTNYKRLAETQALSDRSKISPALPAFATVPGVIYPGPAVLGDARALSTFMLQKQICTSGEAEQIGWLVFDGQSLRDGGVLEVILDLGQGNRSLLFDVPNP